MYKLYCCFKVPVSYHTLKWCLRNVHVGMQKHPLIPASYPGQSNSWGFVQSPDLERKGRIREVPRPFLPASFSLIGMASYVKKVRLKMMRICWIIIRGSNNHKGIKFQRFCWVFRGNLVLAPFYCPVYLTSTLCETINHHNFLVFFLSAALPGVVEVGSKGVGSGSLQARLHLGRLQALSGKFGSLCPQRHPNP